MQALMKALGQKLGYAFFSLPGSLFVKWAGGAPVRRGEDTLSPSLQYLLSKDNGGLFIADTPQQVRAQFARTLAALALPTPPMHHIRDLSAKDATGKHPDVAVRVYYPSPPGDTPLPALIYFHGGGWTVGSIESVDVWCRQLAHSTQHIVVSAEYRLAPEHPFPAAQDDALTVFDWVIHEANRLAIDGRRIAVGGDSAGAHLAASLCFDRRDSLQPPSAQVLFYPPLDMTMSSASYRDNAEGFGLSANAMAWFLEQYAGGKNLVNEPRANVAHREDLAGLPPALIATAAFDPLCDEGRDFAKRLASAGVRIEHLHFSNMIHGFPMFASVEPTSRRATDALLIATDRFLASSCPHSYQDPERADSGEPGSPSDGQLVTVKTE